MSAHCAISVHMYSWCAVPFCRTLRQMDDSRAPLSRSSSAAQPGTRENSVDGGFFPEELALSLASAATTVDSPPAGDSSSAEK